MTYTLVYDAAKQGISAGTIWFVLAGLAGAAFIGYTAWKQGRRAQMVFAAIFAVLWAAGGGFTAYALNYRHLDAAEAAREQRYLVVEGLVADYRPMNPSGHGSRESFTVNGVPFAYSDYDETGGGFNRSAAKGGPVRAGQQVRIAYDEGNRILRLWIRSDQVQPGTY